MANQACKRIVVLGGGLSGLSYVHYLRNFLAFYKKESLLSKVILVEANNYMGGSIKSCVHDDGIVHELGPRSVRINGIKGQNTGVLLEQLGLQDRIVAVTAKSSAGKERYVYRQGKLHKVPTSLGALFRKIPASKSTLFNALMVDFFKKEKMNLDEYPYRDPSLYDFISYRFGPEAAEGIADPLLRGITAGNVRQLSTRALFNDMLANEQAYGSIMKGVFKPPILKSAHDELFPHDILDSKVLDKFQKDGVMSYNLNTGLQTLPEHLCNSLLNTNDDNLLAIYNSTNVVSINFNNKQANEAPCSVEVKTVDGDQLSIKADHIVSTIPANDFVKTLPDSMPAEQRSALENLQKIPHSPVGCVVVEYRKLTQALPKEINSFGFLTHSESDSKVLGISFDTTMFPEIDKPVGSFRMTAMMGGSWSEQVFGTKDINKVTNEQMEQIALSEIRKILGIKDDPYRITPYMWKTGIAQYTPGHTERLQETRDAIEKVKMPLTILGQSYDGVAVNDVVYAARMAASNFVKQL